MSRANPLIQNAPPSNVGVSPTEFLYNAFSESGPQIVGSGRPVALAEQAMDHFEDQLCRAAHYGDLCLIDIDEVDYDGKKTGKKLKEANIDLDEFFELARRDPYMEPVMYYMDQERVQPEQRKTSQLMSLREHTLDAFDNSMFARFLEVIPRLGSWQLCTGPDVNPILGLVKPIGVGCGQARLASDPALPRIRLDPFAPDEETPFYGIEPPIELLLPERHKLKLAFAYKRELCQQFRAEVERVMRQGGQILSEGAAYHIVQMIFHLYADGEDPWQFNMDGIDWEPYYDLTVTGVPWNNMLCNNNLDLREICNWALFEIIEDLREEVTDPRDGRPMECCDTLSIIATDRYSAARLRAMLQAPIHFDITTGNACSETMRMNGGLAREGWDSNVLYNRWIRDIVDERLAILYPLWTADQRKEAMRRTFAAGCFQQAFGWQIEWERETCIRSGDNCTTWENFNQEILWSIKFLEKVGGAYLNPWASWLYQGLPDGELCPGEEE